MKLIFVAFVFIATRVWGLVNQIVTFSSYDEFRQTTISAVLVFMDVSCIVHTEQPNSNSIEICFNY